MSSCFECYYVGVQTWGACVIYTNNPSYGEAITSFVPPCNVSDLDGINVGTNESNATGCLVGILIHSILIIVQLYLLIDFRLACYSELPSRDFSTEAGENSPLD